MGKRSDKEKHRDKSDKLHERHKHRTKEKERKRERTDKRKHRTKDEGKGRERERERERSHKDKDRHGSRTDRREREKREQLKREAMLAQFKADLLAKKMEKAQTQGSVGVVGGVVVGTGASGGGGVHPPADTRRCGPLSNEEHQKRANAVRKVYDPDTGRVRYVKGDGEIVERIVSKEEHLRLNKIATMHTVL
eukprot:CAMPEP_0177653556 /NCGR_PEP_ID=MMETSP0447-20121125/13804_1 /TAXON_ID=0 /ORGANISM="Stygamoeba regulata, Strain BSH-02190019" /LENGTH=192 /DNA_ID=CAMNT_0019157031 /DNA_START=151 /DNA_END=729 /DNA_ORIENTATION=-